MVMTGCLPMQRAVGSCSTSQATRGSSSSSSSHCRPSAPQPLASALPWQLRLRNARNAGIPTLVVSCSPQHSTDQQTEGSSSSDSSTSTDSVEAPAVGVAATVEATTTHAPAQAAAAAPAKPVSIQRTMSGLDALLGIVDIPPAVEESKNVTTTTSISPDALKKLAEAEASRSGKAGPLSDSLEGQFANIIERARKLAELNEANGTGKGAADSEMEQKKLRTEFDSLLQTLNKAGGVDAVSKEDVKQLRDKVFGPMTFWVTEVVPLQELTRSGVVVRGNLRDEAGKVFPLLQAKLEEQFPGKYAMVMVEDFTEPEGQQEDGSPSPASVARARGARASGAALVEGPRVAFQIIPAAQLVPPQSTSWMQFAAVVTSILLFAACVQLALVASAGKLPVETLQYLANPGAYPELPDGALPPGLEGFDMTAYIAAGLPVAASVLGVNTVHEIGHRIAGVMRQVRMGPSYFIPNLQLGSFGAITPFLSSLKNHRDLWDVSAAGPLAGLLMAGSVLTIGLTQSGSDVPQDLLISVPSALFQGSLLLGTIAHTVLGDEALRQPQVMVSPLVIGGWCGLVTTALQLLPAGKLDGGRLVQAAFGKQVLALTSFFTYAGLGLGLLGSTLALPFGLFVIIFQRQPENFIQDSVTTVTAERKVATLVGLLAAIAVLLPMLPDMSQSGYGGDFF